MNTISSLYLLYNSWHNAARQSSRSPNSRKFPNKTYLISSKIYSIVVLFFKKAINVFGKGLVALYGLSEEFFDFIKKYCGKIEVIKFFKSINKWKFFSGKFLEHAQIGL